MTNIQSFITEIFETQKVLILQSEEGFAITFSEEFEYEDESQLEVICFWSSTEKAEQAKQNQWQNHQIETLNLTDFIEQWLIGMFEEVSLAAINFDAEGKGDEIVPLDLLLDIANYGIKNNTNLKFQHFKSFKDLREQIIELKEQEEL